MQQATFPNPLEIFMNTLKFLAATVVATFAAAAYAGPGGIGCPAGAAPGTAGCAAYGMGGNGPGAQGRGLLRLDSDGDGRVSRQEYLQHFDALDTNKDGFISPEEMQAARQALGPRGNGQGWLRWDADGDGRLSRAEVANAPRLSQNFDAIDANKDGFLTADELQAAHASYAGRGGPRGY